MSVLRWVRRPPAVIERETCGARPKHVRAMAGCTHRPDHYGPHYVWWDDGYEQIAITWESA